MSNLVAAYMGGCLAVALRLASGFFEREEALQIEGLAPKMALRVGRIIGFSVGLLTHSLFWPIRLPIQLYKDAREPFPSDEEIVDAAIAHYTTLNSSTVPEATRTLLARATHETLLRRVRQLIENRSIIPVKNEDQT